MPICAAMSPIGSSVARRAISMAGGSGTGMRSCQTTPIRAPGGAGRERDERPYARAGLQGRVAGEEVRSGALPPRVGSGAGKERCHVQGRRRLHLHRDLRQRGRRPRRLRRRQGPPLRGCRRHLRRGGDHQGRQGEGPRQQGRDDDPPRRLGRRRGRRPRRASCSRPPSSVRPSSVRPSAA